MPELKSNPTTYLATSPPREYPTMEILERCDPAGEEM